MSRKKARSNIKGEEWKKGSKRSAPAGLAEAESRVIESEHAEEDWAARLDAAEEPGTALLAVDAEVSDISEADRNPQHRLSRRAAPDHKRDGLIDNRPPTRRVTAANDDVEMLDKDEAELELERMVFGDAEGFKQEIRDFGFGRPRPEVQLDEDEANDNEVDLAGVSDDAIFFTDTAGDADHTSGDGTGSKLLDDGRDGLTSKRKLAWEDSDDDRVTVSLATVPRMRKLRISADEDVVSGKEYIRRLQKQYLILHPTPDWVADAREMSGQKRRRVSTEHNELSDDVEGSSVDDDEDDDLVAPPLSALLRSTNSLTGSNALRGKKRYRAGALNIERQPDVEPVQPSAIASLTLHPDLPLLLTSGPSGTIYLHHLTPSPPAESPNPLLTSLHLRSTALTMTEFHPTAPKILLSGRRRYMHIWDLASGQVEKLTRVYGQAHEQRSFEKFRISPDGAHLALQGSGRKGGGTLNILSAATLQWTAQVRVESVRGGGVADFAWWTDGRGLTVAGTNGEITEWHLESGRVVARWNDEGAVGTTVLALGGRTEYRGDAAVVGPDRYVAVGSSAGVVNLYDRRAWYESHRQGAEQEKERAASQASQVPPKDPKPTRAFDHLTTPISALSFSPDGQLLVMSSRAKRDALRVVHTASATVFANWPTAATPLGRVTATAVGRVAGGGDGGGSVDESVDVLVVGNEAGKVRMWELRP